MNYLFTSKTMARAVAALLQDMTGDQTQVVAHNARSWRVMRFTGSVWVGA